MRILIKILAESHMALNWEIKLTFDSTKTDRPALALTFNVECWLYLQTEGQYGLNKIFYSRAISTRLYFFTHTRLLQSSSRMYTLSLSSKKPWNPTMCRWCTLRWIAISCVIYKQFEKKKKIKYIVPCIYHVYTQDVKLISRVRKVVFWTFCSANM